MTEQTENPTLETNNTSSSVQAGDLTKLLEACREQAGMDIKTASENMRLSLNLLTTLEAEDFANLPEPPYVRGYLRSYAKLAEADAKPLIRTYELLRGADPDAITRDMPVSLSAKSAKPPMSTETMRLALLAGIVILLILISMIPAVRAWMTDLWASFSKPVNAPEFVQTNSATQTPFDPKLALSDKKPESDQTLDTENPPEKEQKPIPQVSEHSETVKQDIVVAQAKAASAAAAEKAQAAQDAQAKQQAIADGIDPNTQELKEAEGDTTEKAADAGEVKDKDKKEEADKEKREPLEGEVTIRLEFSKEVWMQIRQGERQNKGKRIFEALNSAGTVKELKAITPINFKIGNAPAAKLFLNGAPYDLKPHTKGSVARFVIK